MVGLGVWQTPAEDTERAVSAALHAGYRHIDTAAAYGNEAGVGRAVVGSGIPREEVYVTTKLWNSEQGYEKTLAAFDASMEQLGLDYLDLYLIHWPTPAQNLFVDTFKAFAHLRDQGRIRAIGVSNFEPEHLKLLIDATGIVPAVNQIELHPMLNQAALRAVNAEHGIVTEAYSPLGVGNLLSNPTVASIASSYEVTPAQVLIRWNLQLGNVVIPRSSSAERIAQNLDVFGFELSAADMDALSALDDGTRYRPNPDTYTGT